jgi:hypothetical protein
MGANPPQRDTISPMGRILLVVVAACGSAPPPAPALKNVAPSHAAPPAVSPCGVPSFAKRPAGALYGATCDPQLREWIVGVTVVATGPNVPKEQIALSDDQGVFAIAVPPGDYTVTYYFSECRWIRHHHVEGDDTPPIYDPLIQKGCK